MKEETLSTKVAEQAITIRYIMEQFTEQQKENVKQHEALLKSQTDFHEETKETLKYMMDKLDKALEKKAGKWVEKVIYGAAIFVITGLFSYLGTVIIKVIEK